MEVFCSSIEFKLNKLHSKITSKKECVLKSYEANVNRIHIYFQTQERIKNENFNSYRGLLLNLIRKKLDNHIELINNLAFNKNKDALMEQLKNVNNLLLYFKKAENLDTVLDELILNEFEMRQGFNLNQLNKYYDLIISKKRIDIKLHDDSYIEYIQHNSHKFILLPSSRLFICAETEYNKHKMFIINKNGIALYKKDLNYKYEIFDNMFKASNSKIFHLYQNFDDRYDNGYIMVYIYSFSLNLIYSFKLAKKFYMDILISKDEFGFQNVYDKTILIYNTYNYSSTQIELEKDDLNGTFYVSSSIFMFVHFNKDYLYFYSYDAIYIINRNNGCKVTSIFANNFTYVGYSVVFDKYSNIYHFDKDNSYLNVHNLNGKFLFKIIFKEKYKNICFSYKNTLISNQKIKKFVIEYDEY